MVRRYFKKRFVVISTFILGLLILIIFKIEINFFNKKLFFIEYFIKFSYYNKKILNNHKNILKTTKKIIGLKDNIDKTNEKITFINNKLATNNQEVKKLQNTLLDLKKERDLLIEKLTIPKYNPEYKKLDKSIKTLEKNLINMLIFYGKKHPEVIKTVVKLNNLKQKIKKINKYIKVTEKENRKINDIIKDINLKIINIHKEIINKSTLIKKLNYDLLFNKTLIKNLKREILIITNEKIYPDKIDFVVNYKIICGYIIISLLLLLLLEYKDPIFLHSKILAPDPKIIFILNKDVKLSKNDISYNKNNKVLIIDLFPEKGLFLSLGASGRINIKETLNKKSIHFNGKSMYIPKRIGENFEINPKLFYFLIAIEHLFDKIIIHLPLKKIKNDYLNIMKKMGKIKILSSVISEFEIKKLNLIGSEILIT